MQKFPKYQDHLVALTILIVLIASGLLVNYQNNKKHTVTTMAAVSMWEVQTSGTTEYLTGVHFVDTNTGWAVGNVSELTKSPTILKTTDGGATWTPQDSGITDDRFTAIYIFDIYCIDVNTCWILGVQIREWHSPPNDYPFVLKTTTGGVDPDGEGPQEGWVRQSLGQPPAIADIHFADADYRWMVTSRWGAIMHTMTGGVDPDGPDCPPPPADPIPPCGPLKAWYYQSHPHQSWGRFSNIYCIGTETCWTVGNTGSYQDPTPFILFTTNGGIDPDGPDCNPTGPIILPCGPLLGWESAFSMPTTGALYDVYFVDDATCSDSLPYGSDCTGWAVGDSGAILKSTNGGRNWTSQTSGTSENLNVVYFADTNNGWAVGGYETILYTSDGGLTWTPQASGTTVWLSDVSFADADNGWAVGGIGAILKGTNPDTDGDGVLDATDNCVNTPNGPDLGICRNKIDDYCTDSAQCDTDPDYQHCVLSQVDSDGDNIGDACDDSDSDGLLDIQELGGELKGAFPCLDPLIPDFDYDGLLDGEEVNIHGTDPCNSDSDILCPPGSDPECCDNNNIDPGCCSGALDPSDPECTGDSWFNTNDGFEVYGPDGELEAIIENPDGTYTVIGTGDETDPMDPDTDDDGILDGKEIDYWLMKAGLDPIEIDPENLTPEELEVLEDAIQKCQLPDPEDPDDINGTDVDGDNVPDGQADSDGDGTNDAEDILPLDDTVSTSTDDAGNILVSVKANILRDGISGQWPLKGAMVRAYVSSDSCVKSNSPDGMLVSSECDTNFGCRTHGDGQCKIFAPEGSYFVVVEHLAHPGRYPAQPAPSVKTDQVKKVNFAFLDE